MPAFSSAGAIHNLVGTITKSPAMAGTKETHHKYSARGWNGKNRYILGSSPQIILWSHKYLLFISQVYFTLLHWSPGEWCRLQVDSTGIQVNGVDSRWTPLESRWMVWTPGGLHLEFTQIPHALHWEFRWSPSKFYLESNLECFKKKINWRKLNINTSK